MTFFRIVLFIVWLVSAVASAFCVLAHSGEGTGVSDAIMGQMGSASLGVVEKNLDRITVVAIVVFVVSLALMMVVWPDIPVIKAAPVV